jgi:signal transduction histidine kinase
MLMCPWEPAKFLIFSSNVPTLLYYSHLLAILAGLIFAIALFRQRKGSLSIKLFLFEIALFVGWVAIDILLWASNRPDLVLFYWSTQVAIEVLIYAVAFYFSYAFIKKKDMTFGLKAGVSLLLLPIFALLPTTHLLPGIDISYCNVVESDLVIYYSYGVEILLSFMTLFFGFNELRKASRERRREIGFFLLGIVIFLVAFSSGNIIGSLTEDWELAQAGLFGMPVFIGLLAYTAVKFKSFNIKLISTQVIVTALWILTFGVLFIRQIDNVRYVVVSTLVLFTIFGYQLIKSVKREVENRERIEKLAHELEASNLNLEKANARLKELDVMKSEFLSLASHQIRNPLTAIKGYASLVLDGTYGELANADIKQAVEHIYKSTESLVVIVSDFLDISRIEAGTMKYDFSAFDLKELASETSAEYMPNADKAGLKLSFSAAPGEYKVNADMGKIKQVVGNIIDNSIKYTPKGSIDVSLTRDDVKKTYLVKIADTGVGVDPEVLPTLFHKFTRARDAHKTSVTGTGLGLYVAKKMIEAHKGRIWVESAGKGQGSQFYVELPQ